MSSINTNNDIEMLEQMKKHAAIGNYSQAKNIAEYLFQKNSEDIAIKFNLAIIYFYLGEYEKTKILFESQRNDCDFNGDFNKKERYIGALFYTRSSYLHEVITKYLSDKDLPEDFSKALSFYKCCSYIMEDSYTFFIETLQLNNNLFSNKSHSSAINWAVTFHHLFNALAKFYLENPEYYETIPGSKIMYVIGESHALPIANLSIKFNDESYKIKSEVITGMKIWHLISETQNNSIAQFLFQLSRVPDGSKLIITCGEIDARIDEGIIEYYYKNKDIDIWQHVSQMTSRYAEFLYNNIVQQRNFDLFVQGIPAPLNGAIVLSHDQERQLLHKQIIKYFNNQLHAACNKYNMKFLDVYSITVDEHDSSNKKYHIDNYHLRPDYIYQILK
ncbi:MAG: hypothetical protein ACK4OM_01335 [Alphaproteobacteria bacterium]